MCNNETISDGARGNFMEIDFGVKDSADSTVYTAVECAD